MLRTEHYCVQGDHYYTVGNVFSQEPVVAYLLREGTSMHAMTKSWWREGKKINAIKDVRDHCKTLFGETCSLIVAKNACDALFAEWDAQAKASQRAESLVALHPFLTINDALSILDSLDKI